MQVNFINIRQPVDFNIIISTVGVQERTQNLSSSPMAIRESLFSSAWLLAFGSSKLSVYSLPSPLQRFHMPRVL